MGSAAPIKSFCATAIKSFETSDRDEAAEFLTDTHGTDVRVDFHGNPEGFAMRFVAAPLGEAKLVKVDVSGWSIERALDGLVHITVPLKGLLDYSSGAHRVEAAPGKAASVGHPSETVNLKVAHGVGLALYAPIAGLTERAERIAGASLRTDLADHMAGAIDLACPRSAALVRNMKAAMAELTALESIGMSTLALAGYEDLLLNLAACVLFPDVARALGEAPPDCGPQPIRRARDEIRARAAEPIDLAKIASDHGISMRAMQENFRRYFGVSPRDFVLTCRLEQARELLLLTDSVSTVTDVAFGCGFSDLSRFASRYREKYGELPSETLKTSRR